MTPGRGRFGGCSQGVVLRSPDRTDAGGFPGWGEWQAGSVDPNLLDLLLVLGVLAAAVAGWRRGALVQLATLAGAVGGLVLGAAYAPDVARYLVQSPGLGLAAVTLLGVLLALVVGHVLGALVGARLRRLAVAIGIAPLDRAAGLAVTAGGLLLAAWLLGTALAQGPSVTLAGQIRGSEVLARLDAALPDPPSVIARAGSFLDARGFPTVVTGIGPPIDQAVDGPEQGDVDAAVAAAEASTVRIEAEGCGATNTQGSGFVTVAGHVVTNAHVVAGADDIQVRWEDGTHDAVPVEFDPAMDLAVLRADGLGAPGLPWVDEPVERGAGGATLGYPGGSQSLVVRPAAVSGRSTMVGRDIYGDAPAPREVLTVTAPVERGDSGGPFVTSEGRVAGVVFAASTSGPAHGYVLSAESVRDPVAAAVDVPGPVDTGPCRWVGTDPPTTGER